MNALIRTLPIALCAFWLSFLVSQNSLAQTNNDDSQWVIMIHELDAYSYGKLATALKTDNHIEISSACVPVELVLISLPSTDQEECEEHLNRLRIVLEESTGLDKMEVLSDFGRKEFDDECLKARRGARKDN
ncbi:MAG: hypothetical protein HKN32_05540 [Flavobacteriales bacterium]|nr:hypothetical protein [Flavobacteriales bacterium]